MFKLTVKGLWAHKLRYALTGLAVVLGVAFMAGTMVLTDTMKSTFDGVIAGANEGTDVIVQRSGAIDGDPDTAWRTTTYFNRADLGGLKDVVGLVLDLGGPREVESLRILLGGSGTSLSVFASSPGGEVPTRLRDLQRIASLDDAGSDVTVSFPEGTFTRRVVVWLTRLPQVQPDSFRGEVREITVRGRR